MTYTNFVKIKDISANGLWNNEWVLLLAKDFNIASGNIISPKPKTFQETNPTVEDTSAGDTSTSYLNNYNRRKSNVSYTGFNNNTITVTAVYNPTTVGPKTKVNDIVDQKIFTPSKLFELILKPRTVYIKDEVLWDLLSQSEDGSPAIYGENGIPVILKDWNITPSLEGEEITMNLTFIEDKGDTTKRI